MQQKVFTWLQGQSYREDNFLSPTARSKIAANLAMKVMSENVALRVTMEKSFNKNNFMANLIEQVKWLQARGTQTAKR